MLKKYTILIALGTLVLVAGALYYFAPSDTRPVLETAIEGSLGYPSEEVPFDITVCAKEQSTNKITCTSEQKEDQKYVHGVGYRLPVDPGDYRVYAFRPNNEDYRSEKANIQVARWRTTEGVDLLDWQEFASKPGLIVIHQPFSYQATQSPILITGEAKGTWFFEATFPIKLYGGRDTLIAQGYATAIGDWMTEDFVPFEASLPFSVSQNQEGTLVLEKHNASGFPEYNDEIRVPVLLKANSRDIKLYYYNPSLDKDDRGNVLCSAKGLVAVNRKIPWNQTPIQDTIRLLLQGELTAQEKSQGISTEFPLAGVSLEGATLNSQTGELRLAFKDSFNKTSGGACRASILWHQVEATAKQFITVKTVTFSPEELFQP